MPGYNLDDQFTKNRHNLFDDAGKQAGESLLSHVISIMLPGAKIETLDENKTKGQDLIVVLPNGKRKFWDAEVRGDESWYRQGEWQGFSLINIVLRKYNFWRQMKEDGTAGFISFNKSCDTAYMMFIDALEDAVPPGQRNDFFRHKFAGVRPEHPKVFWFYFQQGRWTAITHDGQPRKTR